MNDEEIEEEDRAQFAKEVEEEEEKWKSLGRKKPGIPRSWEVFWKSYKHKRDGKYKGGIDNIRYTYECLEPLLFPFYREITLQIYEPNESECDILGFSFMQDGAPSHASK